MRGQYWAILHLFRSLLGNAVGIWVEFIAIGIGAIGDY